MADYPDWVLKHKKKGTYVNHVKGKYYLYAAHSERVPGTKKVKRICDAYLGRITQEDGLIPSKDKVDGEVTVFDYGLSELILITCNNIHKGLRRTFVKNGDYVMVASILSYIYGRCDNEVFKFNYLSEIYKDFDFDKTHSSKQLLGIDRGTKMIASKMDQVFNENLDDVKLVFSHFRKVKVNDKYYYSGASAKLKTLLSKYKIEME